MSIQNAVSILDSTLRDGVQGEGINYSIQDKLAVVSLLDELGIEFIEAGNPSSNPKDAIFFERVQSLKLKNSKITSFGSTRHKNLKCNEDKNLMSLINANTPYVTIFGKSWSFQVTDIIKTDLQNNLDMIFETVNFCTKNGKEVIFDAEHFFDGWKSNGEYALKTLEAAIDGGAKIITLCDTKGSSMPMDIYESVYAVFRRLGKKAQIGIHTHNDADLAVANSLMAVHAGATHVQGTLLGFGERTGNANLSAIIANLQLKLGYKCIPSENIKMLTPLCQQLAEITNIALPQSMPYIGKNAFAHKAGMHTDAVLKNPIAYEHILPESVGNDRVILLSEVTGRSAVFAKINKIEPQLTKDSLEITNILKEIKNLEKDGYQFEGADASFYLLVKKNMGEYKPFFNLQYYKVIGEQPEKGNPVASFAQIKIEINGKTTITAGEGDGPVHALDVALRSALEDFFPVVKDMRLTDFKVRVLDSKDATAARVRVLVESTDGKSVWTTVGVSTDVIEASWLALVDSFEYKLGISNNPVGF